MTVGLGRLVAVSASVAQLRRLTIVRSFVPVLPILVHFVALQRYWRSALAAGTV